MTTQTPRASREPPAAGRKSVPIIVWPLVAIVGTAAFAGAARMPGALSFLAGLALAGFWLGTSMVLVSRAGIYSPSAGLIAAIMSYLGLILFFAILLGSLDASHLHTGAFAVGLLSAVLISSTDQLLRGWIWSERH